MRGIPTKRALIVLQVEWPDRGPASGPAPGLIIAAIEREIPSVKVSRFAIPTLYTAGQVTKERKPPRKAKNYDCSECGHRERSR